MPIKSTKARGDNRLEQILKFLQQFAQGNLDIKLEHSGNRDEIDGIMVGMNMIIEEVKANYINEAYAKKRLTSIQTTLLSYAKQNFDTRLKITNDNPVFDELSKSINNLGGQLKDSRVKGKKMLNDLTDRYNEMMQFNYIVSHNLRAPIANIVGLANLMSIPSLDMEKKIKIIDHIRSATVIMDEMVKDLNIILATKSALNTKRKKVSIPFVITTISDTLEKEIFESGTIIKTTFPDNAQELFTIKSYIESILYNLISNSIKYQSALRKPAISIYSKKVNNNIIIVVSDNGIGIDLVKNGHYLFGLYKRFHLETEGKGLGLHMTKIQVEALGGKITVESEPGKGTTFTIKLPIQK